MIDSNVWKLLNFLCWFFIFLASIFRAYNNELMAF